MDVAVVGGTGDEGLGLALRLAQAGHHVTIGSRDAANAARRRPQEAVDLVGAAAAIDGADERRGRVRGRRRVGHGPVRGRGGIYGATQGSLAAETSSWTHEPADDGGRRPGLPCGPAVAWVGGRVRQDAPAEGHPARRGVPHRRSRGPPGAGRPGRLRRARDWRRRRGESGRRRAGGPDRRDAMDRRRRAADGPDRRDPHPAADLDQPSLPDPRRRLPDPPDVRRGDSARMTEEGRHVAIDDTELWVVERGSADAVPMFVLHGGPGLDHHEFGDYLDPLTDRGIRLLLVDLRSHGPSAPTDTVQPGRWSATRRTSMMLARALGVDRYVVFGHSYGAFVALQNAVDYPGMAAATIVSAGVPSARWLEAVEEQLATFEPVELRDRVAEAWARETDVRTPEEVEQLLWVSCPSSSRIRSIQGSTTTSTAVRR